ncbi:hypothetical protein ABPG72_003325 [Tetrahymena utriculariae]
MNLFLKAKQFYIQNSQTLFKGCKRSFAQACFALFVEYAILFTIIFSPKFIEKQKQIDPNSNFLEYVSIHLIPCYFNIILTKIFLGLNICAIMLIQIYFISYLIKPFKQKKGFLSILVVNYNQFFTIPFYIISVHQRNIYSIINIVLTAVLSQFCSIQCNNDYNYNQSDYLSKKGNSWDQIKPTFILVCIFSLSFDGNHFYCLFTLLYSLFNNLNFINFNFYYSKVINKLFFFANILITLISLITISLSIVQINYSILIPLIIIPCLSYKIAQAAVEHFYSKIITKIQFILDNNMNELNSIQSDKLIDFYTRYLIENLRCDEGKLLKRVHEQSQTFLTSIKDHKLIQHVDDKVLEKDQGQNKFKNINLGQFIFNEDENAFQSLQDQLKYLKQAFQVQKNISKEQYQEKNKEINSIRELFYILEIEQNIPKLTIKLQQYVKQQGKYLSLEDYSLINYIQDKIQKKVQIKSEQNSLQKAFQYEEQIEFCICQMKHAIKQKLKFLQNISKDNFDLQIIIKEGVLYLNMRNKITQLLLNLKAENDQNNEYVFLQNIYQNAIQIDPDDKKFLQKQLLSFQFEAKNQIRKKINIQQAFKSSYLIIVSLASNELGNIKKVSRNVKKLTGYDQADLIDQNVNIQMPQSIAIHHNSLIRESIESGHLTQFQMNKAPLILRAKNQFGIKFQIIFQIQQKLEAQDPVNLIGQVKILNQPSSKFALIDVFHQKGHRMDIISKAMWTELLQNYFSNLTEVEKTQIHQIIPTLTNIKDYLLKQNINKKVIQTLAFIPRDPIQKEYYQKRYVDKCDNILTNIKKGYFNYDFNDVYLLDIDIKLYSKEPFYEILKLKFKSINKLIDQNMIESAIQTVLLPQWIGFGFMTEDNLEKFDFNLKEEVLKLKPRISQINDSQNSTNIQIDNSTSTNQKRQSFNKFQNSLNYFDQKLYPPEDSFRTCSQTTDRQRKNSEFDQLKTQASPNHEILCITPHNEALQEILYLNEQKVTQVQRKNSKEQILETLFSPAQSRFSQKISMSNLLLKFCSNQRIVGRDKQIQIQKSNMNINLIQKSQQIQSEEESQQNFEKSEGELERINKTADQGSINNSNKSQGSALSQFKKMIVKKLLSKKSVKKVQLIAFYMVISFLLIFVTVAVTHADLQQKITHQQTSFGFSSWQDMYSTNLLKGLNCYQIYELIQLQSYTFSKYPAAYKLQNELSSTIQTLYSTQKSNIINLMDQDINEVFVKQELLNTYIDFVYLTPTFKNITIQTSVFDSLIVLTNFVPSLLMQNQYGLIKELELIVNAGAIQNSLMKVSDQQGGQEKKLNNDIKQSSTLTLILVSMITAIMAIFIIPFYYYFQSRQEKVLRYFATIEPQSIAEMTEKLCKSLVKLVKKKKSFNNKSEKEEQENCYQVKQNIKKQKKHISTTSLPKFNLKITLYAFLLLASISIQPIVNYCLTDLQINQQTSIQSFIRKLYQFQEQLYSVYYSLQIYSAKVANPYVTLIPTEQIQQFFLGYVAQANQFESLFVSDFGQIQSGKIFSDSDTLNSAKIILSGDTCKFLQVNQNYTLTYDQCSQIYQGAYNKGLIRAYSVFMLKVQGMYEICNRPQDASTFSQIDKYFLENSPLEDDDFFEIFEESIKQLLDLIQYQNDLFKLTIDYTQISLFIFEVCLLTLLLPIVVVPFFNYINNRHIECTDIVQRREQRKHTGKDENGHIKFINDSLTQSKGVNELIKQKQEDKNQKDQKFQSQYENQQIIHEIAKERILEQVKQIRLTANFDNILNAVPYYQIKLVKRAFRLVSYEIHKMLSIEISSDTLRLEKQNCSEINYNINEYNNGIPESDLHIYITKYYPQLSRQSEKVVICQYNNNQRASVGIISLDFSNYNIQDESFLFSIIAQELFSQIYHILGLSKDLIARFVDDKGIQITLDKIIQTVQYEFSYSVLVTKQIQQVSQQIFNCTDIQGILTEIKLGKSIFFSNAFVNPQSLGADIVLSGRIFVSQIDYAFLRDTGFYSIVNKLYQNDESDQSLAYQKGCDFYKQLCLLDSTQQNFCSQDIKKCDNNQFGIAVCNDFDSEIPCKFYQVVDKNNFCFNSESNYLNDLNYYGNDSRCFESTLQKFNSDSSTNDLARCLQNQCIENNTKIQIQFNSEILICSQENQKVVSVQNKGYIICPSNFQKFCQQNIQKCPKNCSKNGLCINGKCECYSGYSGDDCQNINCLENSQFGCLQCSQDGSNLCLKCQQGLYLSIDKQECLQDCQIDQFIDQITQQCKGCQQGCKYCNNNEQCITCADKWYLNQINQCVSKCPDGFFQEEIQQTQPNGKQISKWICSKCHQACTTCFGFQINQCNGCRKYYTLVLPNTCQHPKCEANYYALNDKICIQCPSNCLSCTANEICFRCENGFILINGKCQNSVCKNGQIFVYQSLKCEYCDEGCTQCFGKTSNCLNCQQNYYLWNNQCLQTCPYGFYKQLSDLNQSVNDNIELTKNNQQIGMTSNYCSPCHKTCSDCIDPSQNDCSSCPPNYYLNVQDKSCKKSLLSNCIVALSEAVCLICDAYYFLQNNKCQPTSCSPNFYAVSVDNLTGFLSVQPSYKCLPCSYGCEECIDQNKCLQCSKGFQLDSDRNKCISLNISCQNQQYFDFQNQLCADCTQNCLRCRDSNICLSCTNNQQLVNFQCQLPNTPPKTYYNQQLQQFLMCANPCSSCQDSVSCINCYDPTDVLYESQCIHQCPTGYFKQANILTNISQCQQCDKTCLLCKDQQRTSCTICQEGYEYYTNLSLCLPQCSSQSNSGLYYDLTKQKCLQCMKNCVKCQNQITCTQCQQGMFYDIQQGQCSNCMDGCNICSDINNCQQCQVGTVYVNQQCQKICTVKDLNCLRCDPITNLCVKCSSDQPVQSNGFCPVICNLQNCQRCSSSTQCGECDDDYYLDINQQCQFKYCQIPFCQQCNFSKYIPYCTKCQKVYLLTEDGTCSSKQCPQFGQQCQQCLNDQSCKTCVNGFYFSKEYNQCLSCPDKCSSCDQYQCFQYNTCPNGYYLFEKQCLNCFELCQKCNGPNKSDCLDQGLQRNCHYTCKECLGTDYNQCISCPENRILTFYYNVKYGECMCPYGTYDTLQIKCMEGRLDQIQRDLTIGFSYLGAVGVIAQSLISFNPAMFYLLSEFAQTLGQIQYINIKKAYDFDQTVYALQHFNYNILSGVGSNVKPKEQNSILRMLEVRLEDLEKITSFYRTNNFISNSEILIFLNAACFSLMIFSNCLVHSEVLKKYKNLKSVLRAFRFSLPAFMLVLTSSEMCVTIQLQMKKFDLDSDQALALFLSIIFFTYQFVWIVIIIIQLGIKNSIRKKEHKLIFRIFNRKKFWQRIFLALLFVKKQFLSIILINVFKQPITLLFIQLITEIVFSIYIIVIKPYRGSIFKRFALLNQFTYIIVNVFLILISSNEDQESETKPILYIFILSLILLVLVLYSIFSFYLIIKFVSQKVANSLTNRSEKAAILQKTYTSSITLRKTSTSENQVLNQIQELQSQSKNQKQDDCNSQLNNFELVNIDQNKEQITDNIFITNDCQINTDEEHHIKSTKNK